MKQVAVALSGGVDSSVSAALLKERGYSVVGFFISVRTPFTQCVSEEDRIDAMRACAALQIPFLEYAASEVYTKEVLEPFVQAYRNGETPNPDVWCNSAVKFSAAFRFLKEQGLSCMATGHYAQIRELDGRHVLFRSVDEQKDQTYFLYTLPSEILSTLLFPVGAMRKEEVRAHARRLHLPAAEKRDSTGLCFLGDISLRRFLEEQIGIQKGQVVDERGVVLGEHDGVWFFTIGQRHGFTITDKKRGPYVVVRKDRATNTLTVAFPASAPENVGSTSVLLREVVLRRARSSLPPLFARYRHRGALFPVSVAVEKNTMRVVAHSPQAIAAGQSVVLYTEEGECVGGGVVCL